MKKQELLLITILSLSIFIMIIFISTNSKAIPVSENPDFKKKIINYQDYDLLYKNIKEFIETNDDILIALSSYEENTYLYNNYDYITNVAENYIIDNNDYYSNIEDNMIDVKYIYEITNNFFGKKDYFIKDLKDGKIYLNKIDKRFNMNLVNLTIENLNNTDIIVNTTYELEKSIINYKYIFIINQNNIYLKNIEVEYEEN